MKRKIFSTLFALVLVLSFSLVTAVPVSAANTLEVGLGEPYTTIQAAVNVASPRDTVLVHPGTYAESITINALDGLTLESTDGAQNTTIDATDILGDGITITWSDEVTVRGFTILKPGTGPLPWPGLGIGIRADKVTDLTIENNIINSQRGIYCVNLVEDSSISNNRIEATDVGIAFEHAPTDRNNIIEGNTIVAGDNIEDEVFPYFRAIYIQDTYNSIIKDNTMIGTGTTVSGPGVTGSENDHITITKNVIKGFKRSISLWVSTHIEISGNQITDNWDDGIRLKGQHIRITENDIKNNAKDGVHIDEYVILTLDVVVDFNNIEGNGDYGVSNAVETIEVDAQYNWWGSPTGPCRQLSNDKWVGKGDKVSGNVDYIPWSPHPY